MCNPNSHLKEFLTRKCLSLIPAETIWIETVQTRTRWPSVSQLESKVQKRKKFGSSWCIYKRRKNCQNAMLPSEKEFWGMPLITIILNKRTLKHNLDYIVENIVVLFGLFSPNYPSIVHRLSWIGLWG